MDIFEAAGHWGQELADALGAGADPNARDSNGRTPLFRAAKVGVAQVQLLLEARADPNARDNQGFAPLHFAASPPFATGPYFVDFRPRFYPLNLRFRQ
jgi:ankyrin repeat protein